MSSLRIAPPANHATSTNNTSTSNFSSSSHRQSYDRGAPSAPGLPDTLRASHSLLSSSPSDPSAPTTSTPSSSHPLESRLSQWTSRQETLRSTLLRRNFGIAEPLRRGMELKMVRDADSFRPTVLGAPARLHDDILSNRDAEIAWEDVYNGQDGLKLGFDVGGDGQAVGWTEEMERKVGMGKW